MHTPSNTEIEHLTESLKRLSLTDQDSSSAHTHTGIILKVSTSPPSATIEGDDGTMFTASVSQAQLQSLFNAISRNEYRVSFEIEEILLGQYAHNVKLVKLDKPQAREEAENCLGTIENQNRVLGVGLAAPGAGFEVG